MCPQVVPAPAAAGPPRVLHLTLRGQAGLQSRTAPWSSSDPDLDRVGRWSGAALALALLSEVAARDGHAEAPLVLAVGECVGRGVPTAARATVASRSPTSGLYTDGQVGGDLARRLAPLADAVVLSGRVEPHRGATLVLDGGGPPRLEFLPALVGTSPAERHRLLCAHFGSCATLSVGPAGDRGLPFASLAVGDTNPHFVGRGGLGAVFGRMGLAALVVAAPEAESPAPMAPARPALLDALLASPRLEGRARGGTLELFGARAARGDLRARAESEPVSAETAASLTAEIEQRRESRHGCQGCPTPCGWIFERSSGRGQGARFGASQALGLNLGLERFDDALRLLAACDDLGADAKDLGASLALLCSARERGLPGAPGPAPWGDIDTLVGWVRGLGDQPAATESASERGVRELLSLGACKLAARLGLEHGLRVVRGGVLGPEISLAAFLGQCVSARGVDPMRTLSFSTLDAAGRLAELVAPLELPAGAEDPESAAGKGRLVWWFENLATALDATGFCAFSAVALVVDGTSSLDDLAREIAPRVLLAEVGPASGPGPGQQLLQLGAELVHLQRRLNRTWAGPGALDLPAWTRERLDQPGLWPEYRRWRGLDQCGDPGPVSASGAHVQDSAREPAEELPRAQVPGPAQGAAGAVEPGAVTLVARGVLADALGPEAELALDLPARLEDVLAHAARRWPAAGIERTGAGRGLPSVYRDGLPVGLDDWVRAGDRLDLLLVISGGSG